MDALLVNGSEQYRSKKTRVGHGETGRRKGEGGLYCIKKGVFKVEKNWKLLFFLTRERQKGPSCVRYYQETERDFV